MKKFKLNAIFLLTVILFINSCGITQQVVWGSKSYKESFKNYFIDEKNNRVVLIGENKTAYEGRENYHYAIKDVGKNIDQVFKLGIKTKNLEMSLYYPKTTGTKFEVRDLGVGFDKKKLSINEIDFLHTNQFTDGKTGSKIGRGYEEIELVRYPASEEMATNYQVSILNFTAALNLKNEIEIQEQNTPLQTTGKILLTPLTLAADILLIPITVPYFIYTQIKESQTEHFCQGEFCGYDKLPQDSKLTK